MQGGKKEGKAGAHLYSPFSAAYRVWPVWARSCSPPRRAEVPKVRVSLLSEGVGIVGAGQEPGYVGGHPTYTITGFKTAQLTETTVSFAGLVACCRLTVKRPGGASAIYPERFVQSTTQGSPRLPHTSTGFVPRSPEWGVRLTGETRAGSVVERVFASV